MRSTIEPGGQREVRGIVVHPGLSIARWPLGRLCDSRNTHLVGLTGFEPACAEAPGKSRIVSR